MMRRVNGGGDFEDSYRAIAMDMARRAKFSMWCYFAATAIYFIMFVSYVMSMDDLRSRFDRMEAKFFEKLEEVEALELRVSSLEVKLGAPAEEDGE